MQFSSSYITEVTHHQREQLYMESVAAGYYVQDRFALVGEVPFYYVRQKAGDNGLAGGFDLLARYHVLEFEHVSFFIDGGAGAFVADKRVPRGGTNFNFTPQVGLGMTCPLADNVFLILGIRAWHLSNAGIHGDVRNPSVNFAIQSYAALAYTF